MIQNTSIIFNVDAKVLFIGTVVFFFALLGIIWKGKEEIQKTIKESIGDFRDRFISMESKMEILWKDEIAPSNSPRQLNNRGRNILNESGIKEIIDEKKSELLRLVKEKNPDNPYDANVVIEDIMNDLPKHYPEILANLKDGAFNTGSDISSILFAGSIYLRNEIFSDLGFSIDDLDAPKKLNTSNKEEAQNNTVKI